MVSFVVLVAQKLPAYWKVQVTYNQKLFKMNFLELGNCKMSSHFNAILAYGF